MSDERNGTDPRIRIPIEVNNSIHTIPWYRPYGKFAQLLVNVVCIAQIVELVPPMGLMHKLASGLVLLAGTYGYRSALKHDSKEK